MDCTPFLLKLLRLERWIEVYSRSVGMCDVSRCIPLIQLLPAKVNTRLEVRVVLVLEELFLAL